MDDVLPKSKLSACFGSKANAKANISFKLHPVTQGSVSTTKALTSIWGSEKISPQKEVKTGCYTTDYSILVIMNRGKYSLQCTDYNHNWFFLWSLNKELINWFFDWQKINHLSNFSNKNACDCLVPAFPLWISAAFLCFMSYENMSLKIK